MGNYILWIANSGYTTPVNLYKVNSSGFETQCDISYNNKRTTFFITTLVDVNEAITKESKLVGDASIGKQIAYMPRLKYNISLGIKTKRYYVLYNHSYTGIRFTSSDESQWLNGYSLGNFSIGQNIKIKKLYLNCNLNINNAWNQSYQIIANRAVPLRSFQFTISIII